MWVRGLKLISLCIVFASLRASHPMWVRGLKLALHHQGKRLGCVAPHVGAWIETPVSLFSTPYSTSHPMWVRGLKLKMAVKLLVLMLSHPMWVRGLKLSDKKESSRQSPVAPHVGAWIETSSLG